MWPVPDTQISEAHPGAIHEAQADAAAVEPGAGVGQRVFGHIEGDLAVDQAAQAIALLHEGETVPLAKAWEGVKSGGLILIPRCQVV